LVFAAFIALFVPLTLAQAPLQTSLLGFGDVKDPGQAYTLLESLAKAALTDENVGRIRVSLTNGILTYNFLPASEAAPASRPDRLAVPLEILIRVEVLRRDFQACASAQAFWVGSLQHVQSLVRDMVRTAYETSSEDEWKSKKKVYEDRVGAEFAVLKENLLAFAKTAGLNVAEARGPAPGFEATVVIGPPKARVRYMPWLTYQKCVAFHDDLDKWWNELSSGKQQLIGRYAFLAEWPPSLDGPVAGNFEVNNDGATVDLHPRGH